jgi:MarR family transcriptional regulator, lower aerobic nicotinate degradation pathway regulator
MAKREHDLTDGLFEMSFLLHSRLTRIASEHDLSLTLVRLMGILRDHEPGMLELARYLELEKSSLSGLVERAEKRGLVERIPSPHDGRSATVRVTASGRRLSRTFEEQVRAEVRALVQPLPRADQERLASLVWRLLPVEAQA